MERIAAAAHKAVQAGLMYGVALWIAAFSGSYALEYQSSTSGERDAMNR